MNYAHELACKRRGALLPKRAPGAKLFVYIGLNTLVRIARFV